MNLRQTFHAATLAGLLLLPAPDRLDACAFHTTLPEATVSQEIAGAIELVAARPAASNPFRFEPVAILKGTASSSRPPHLVDSATRMRLAQNPDAAVLFARAADGSWTRLLLLDAATWPVVDIMLARAGDWTTAAGAGERRDTFAGLLAHPDARLRRIALRELDALPYSVLREGTYPVTSDDLLRGIADIQDTAFAPIRILLLGLSESQMAKEAIERRLSWLADASYDRDLGAWITAAIENGGEDGISTVMGRFGSSKRDLTISQLAELIRAFSVHRIEGDPNLHSLIDRSLRELTSLTPEAAPLIAQTFGPVGDFSQVNLVRDLVSQRAFKRQQDLMAATAYLMQARATPAPQRSRTVGTPGTPTSGRP